MRLHIKLLINNLYKLAGIAPQRKNCSVNKRKGHSFISKLYGNDRFKNAKLTSDNQSEKGYIGGNKRVIDRNIMQPKISGVILAGGRATRMGGNDKGLILLNGLPLYQHIANKLHPQVDELILNANQNLEIYHQSRYQVVTDLTPDSSGPLAGMLATLKSASHDWVVFVPCDVPDFPADLVARLWQGKQHALAAYADDGNRPHPTLALLHRSLSSQLGNYLANGDRKLMLFMYKIGAIAVQFADNPAAFTNLNTPEEYQNWEHIQEIKKMSTKPPLPLLGITAYSGTGKTTLLKKVIPLLRQQQIRVGLIKHTHHDMDVDKPGKDSYELRKAGAEQTLVANQQRWALMTEISDSQALDLSYLANRFDSDSLDLILVEGFKDEPINKIALYRRIVNRPLSDLLDQHVIAVASDEKLETTLPQLNINQPEQVADFIVKWLNIER